MSSRKTSLMRFLPLAIAILSFGTIPGESLDRAFLAAVEKGNLEEVKILLKEGADPDFRRVETSQASPEKTALGEAVRGRHLQISKFLLGKNLDERVIASAIRSLPAGTDAADLEINRVVIDTLFDLGKKEFLVAESHHFDNETAFLRLTEDRPAADRLAFFKAIDDFSWETVMKTYRALSGVEVLHPEPEFKERWHEGIKTEFPSILVTRIKKRFWEEAAAVELLNEMKRDGLSLAAWGELTERAATQARLAGLLALADELRPGLAADEWRKIEQEVVDSQYPYLDPRLDRRKLVHPPIRDDDRMASAFYQGMMDVVTRYEAAGIKLSGDSQVDATALLPRTLAGTLISEKKFEMLLESGIDLSAWEDASQNPYLAATDLETVEWLLNRKIPFGPDASLLPDLLRGELAEKIEMVERLMDAGADIKALEQTRGWNALHALILIPADDQFEAVSFLIEAGVDPKQKDKVGKTATDYAEETYQFNLMRLLDPEKKSGYWEKYGSPEASSFAGGWGGGGKGLTYATLLLSPTGEGRVRSGEMGDMLTLWRIEGEKAFVDLVFWDFSEEGQVVAKVHSGELRHPNGDQNRIEISSGKELESYSRAMSAQEAKKAFSRWQEDWMKRPRENKNAENEAQPEEIRTRLDKELENDYVLIKNWPDETFPAEFRSEKVKSLIIVGGNLKELPDDMGECFPKLEKLEISGVPLESCPENLGAIAGLTSLRLTGMNFYRLAQDDFPNLKSLNLNGNRLNEVPQSWLSGGKLESCDLSNNRFRQIPQGLQDCEGLKYLNVSANMLGKVSLGHWLELESLNLNENRITSLSAELGAFKELRTLYLAGNRLERLPEAVEKLPNLGMLVLSHNNLTDIPEEILGFPKLGWISLKGNLISDERKQELKKRVADYRIRWE